MAKRIITVDDILQAAARGERSIDAAPGQSIVTAHARDKAAELGISLEASGAPGSVSSGAACAARSEQPADQVVSKVCELVAGRLPNLDAKDVERIVRGVVEAKLGAGQARAAAPGNNDSSFTDQVEGVCFISGERVLKSSSGPVPVAEKVMVADALYGNGDARLAGGFMEWEGASFPRTVESAEIGIVLQGELHLTVGGQTRVGKPGDMIYFPKGSKVIYSAPSRVRLACVNCVE